MLKCWFAAMKTKKQGKDITRKKGAKIHKKIEGKQSWYSLKTLGESPSRPSTRQEFQQVTYWQEQLGNRRSILTGHQKCSTKIMLLAKFYRKRWWKAQPRRRWKGPSMHRHQVSEPWLTLPSDSNAEILETYKCNFQKKKRSSTLSILDFDLQHSTHCSYSFLVEI